MPKKEKERKPQPRNTVLCPVCDEWVPISRFTRDGKQRTMTCPECGESMEYQAVGRCVRYRKQKTERGK